MYKPPLILFVHLRKVIRIGEEDGALDDMLQRRATLVEDSAEILDASARLLCYAAFDGLAVSVVGDLAGDVESCLGVDADGLGLGESR